MSIKDIAILIPAHDRKQLLEDNVISIAKIDESDIPMHYLIMIWKTYIEPGFISTCNSCRDRILQNYRQMQPYLVELEKESNLLNVV